MKKHRIIVFSSISPLPMDRGDRNRLFHVVQLLNQIGDVHLVYMNREWESPVGDLAPLGRIEVCSIPICKNDVIRQSLKSLLNFRPFIVYRYRTQRAIDQFLRQMDSFRPTVAWGFQISSYPFLRETKGIGRVLDLVDSPSRYATLAGGAQDIPFQTKLHAFLQWRIKDYERRAMLDSDITLINSRQDIEYLIATHGQIGNIHHLDNCVPAALTASKWQADPRRPHRILFVGNLAYPPNAAGVSFFVREVFPIIKSFVPGVEFMVCGSGYARLAKEFSDIPSVRFAGYVEDLVSLYLDASVLVVPVPMAGGPQYKLLEGMALGLPVVASHASAQSGTMRDGQELLIGDAPEQFASAVLSILRDPELALRLSSNAQAFIRAHHTWESKLDMLRGILDGLG